MTPLPTTSVPGAPSSAGAEMHALVRRLFPICRSLTGDGVRDSLRILSEYAPLEPHDVPSGTQVFDWVVPREWNVREAYIARPSGERIVDFRRNTLHLVGYSVPVRRTMTLGELQPHLHSLPSQPTLIPYRTSYYREQWGFCLSHDQRLALDDGPYDVVVDSRLNDGALTYGECVLPGEGDRDVLFYTHTCHPSLANDNLAGMVVCACLARWLASRPRRYTYRFVFGPGTIGSLAWLSRNMEQLPRIRHGLVGVLLGLPERIRYKQTKTGDAPIDRIVRRVLVSQGIPHVIEPFGPYGYDERQFGSPGFNLPIGRLSRAAEEGYPEYHTSADTPALVSEDALAHSLAVCQSVVEAIESERYCRNLRPYGEPQLGRYGLYRPSGGDALPSRERARLWMLSLSDGMHSLLDIAEHSGLAAEALEEATSDLVDAGLLEVVR